MATILEVQGDARRREAPYPPMCPERRLCYRRIVEFVGAVWNAPTAAQTFRSAPGSAASVAQHYRSVVLRAVIATRLAPSFVPSAARLSPRQVELCRISSSRQAYRRARRWLSAVTSR